MGKQCTTEEKLESGGPGFAPNPVTYLERFYFSFSLYFPICKMGDSKEGRIMSHRSMSDEEQMLGKWKLKRNGQSNQ